MGVDLGTASVKIVELASEGKTAKLLSYGFSDQESSEQRHKKLSEDEVAKTIKEIVKVSRIQSKNVIAALPAFSVFSSIITLPDMPQKDIASAVQWEAKKVIPLPLEEMVLDWKTLKPLDEGEKKSIRPQEKGVIISESKKNIRVLLTSAPKDLVERYVKIFKKANLNLMILESEVFAQIHALVGNDPDILMLVDIGAVTTNISIVDRGIPVLNRSIDVAGRQISEKIAETLGVDFLDSEVVKKDFVLPTGQDMPKLLENAFLPIVNEIRYILNLYQTESHSLTLSDDDAQRRIQKIILSGGVAYFSGMPEFLSKILDIQVLIGDPFAKVSYPEELRPVLEELGPSFSVAIGCSLRNIVSS